MYKDKLVYFWEPSLFRFATRCFARMSNLFHRKIFLLSHQNNEIETFSGKFRYFLWLKKRERVLKWKGLWHQLICSLQLMTVPTLSWIVQLYVSCESRNQQRDTHTAETRAVLVMSKILNLKLECFLLRLMIFRDSRLFLAYPSSSESALDFIFRFFSFLFNWFRDNFVCFTCVELNAQFKWKIDDFGESRVTLSIA